MIYVGLAYVNLCIFRYVSKNVYMLHLSNINLKNKKLGGDEVTFLHLEVSGIPIDPKKRSKEDFIVNHF